MREMRMFYSKQFTEIIAKLDNIKYRVEKIEAEYLETKEETNKHYLELLKNHNEIMRMLSSEITVLKDKVEIYEKYYDMNSPSSDEIKKKVIEELELKKMRDEIDALKSNMNNMQARNTVITPTPIPMLLPTYNMNGRLY